MIINHIEKKIIIIIYYLLFNEIGIISYFYIYIFLFYFNMIQNDIFNNYHIIYRYLYI